MSLLLLMYERIVGKPETSVNYYHFVVNKLALGQYVIGKDVSFRLASDAYEDTCNSLNPYGSFNVISLREDIDSNVFIQRCSAVEELLQRHKLSRTSAD